jgi:hypothetical protein
MTIAGKTFTVSQQGVPTCSVYTTAGGFNVAYTGRQLLFPVYADSTCSWSATTNVSWISFVSGTPGSGNATVTFNVDANTGAARTGTIIIGTVSVTVNQAGHPASSSPSSACTYSVSPVEQAVSASANLGKLTVSTSTGCTWSATSSVSWISLGTTSGSGTGSALYTVTPNTSTLSRSGTLTIAGKTVKLTQAGVTVSAKKASTK